MPEEIKNADARTGPVPPDGNGSGDNVTLSLSKGEKDIFTGLAAPQTQDLPQPQTPSLASLLGPKPVFSKAAYQQQMMRRSKMARRALTVALLAGLAVYGFFQSQLNPNFTWFSAQLGSNTAQQFERSNLELKKTQTQLNLARLRAARLWLDEVNSQIDPYQKQVAVFNSDFSARIEKENAQIQQQILGAKIKNSLREAQKLLNEPFGVNLYTTQPVTPEQNEELFESLLREDLVRQKAALSDGSAQSRNEMRVMDNVIRLVENKKFRDAISSADLASVREDEFSAMLDRIRAEGTDELSLIDRIKKNRLDWAEVIQNIHSVTRKADASYGQGLFKTVGGFLFNAYRFDAKNGRISMTGVTKTSDSKTFSFIANLVDAIEKSPKFRDIDFRSFSKSRDEKGDFSSSVNLEFSLQSKSENDSRDDTPQSEHPPQSAPAVSSPSSTNP